MKPDVLRKIEAYMREELQLAKRALPLGEMLVLAKAASLPRAFISALRRKHTAHEYALIAEIKKASPSKGPIRRDFDPALLARAYEDGGAACLSVLTDKPSFQGDLGYMTTARAVTNLPVLRKDFMIEVYQFAEARAHGADCILIIIAALEDETATDIEAVALELGMDVLIEIHDRVELERALRLQSPMIDINHRNLRTFETTLEISAALVPQIPKSPDRGRKWDIIASRYRSPRAARHINVLGGRKPNASNSRHRGNTGFAQA